MVLTATGNDNTEFKNMHRLMLFLLFLLSGFLVFFIGGYLGTIPRGIRTLIKLGVPILFLALTVLLYRSGRFKAYWHLALALFAASFGFLVGMVGQKILG